jgi:hypothetical protein
MRAVLARGEAAAEARVRAVAERVAAAVDVPGVTAEVVGDDVVLSGRGLARRALTDPRLRDGEWRR